MEVRLGALPGKYESDKLFSHESEESYSYVGESFSDVLAWNHFGTETIPPRPVLRIAAEKTIEKLGSSGGMTKSIIDAFLNNLLTNPMDAKKHEREFLRKVGSQSIAEAKRIIDANTELRENASATVAKKGFNQPLYETGELEDHLGFEIID
jgi:hypothetical protein